LPTSSRGGSYRCFDAVINLGAGLDPRAYRLLPLSHVPVWDFLDDQDIYGQQELHKRYVNKKIWLFGLEPEGVASFLEAYGWRVAEHHNSLSHHRYSGAFDGENGQ
jgi:O-methyltransferase involved in polyketide biosynthesis